MMRCAVFMLTLTLLITSRIGIPADTQGGADPKQVGINLVETGNKTADGKPLYTLRAESAPVAGVLRALFAKTGEQYRIDEGVVGFVDLYLKNVPAERILQEIQESRDLPIVITREKGTTLVRRAPDMKAVADAARNRMELTGPRLGAGGFGGGVGGTERPQVAPMLYMQQQSTLETPVTIDIPAGKPVPFNDAIQMIARQSSVPLKVDERIPTTLMISITATRTPLRMVLDAMHNNFKWVPMGSYIMIAPTDQMLLMLNAAVIGGSPTQPCPNCRQPVVSAWSFCPNCGAPLARNALQNRGQLLKGGGRALPGNQNRPR